LWVRDGRAYRMLSLRVVLSDYIRLAWGAI
jgi:hypothetical protein